jgi:hypothetical protein
MTYDGFPTEIIGVVDRRGQIPQPSQARLTEVKREQIGRIYGSETYLSPLNRPWAPKIYAMVIYILCPAYRRIVSGAKT